MRFTATDNYLPAIILTAILTTLSLLQSQPETIMTEAMAAPHLPDDPMGGDFQFDEHAGAPEDAPKHLAAWHPSPERTEFEGRKALKVIGKPAGRGLVALKTRSGKRYVVSARHAGKFKCIVGKLEASGYRIAFLGGYARRKIAGRSVWSKHADGLALDINQTARNRVSRRLPASTTAMARACGLLHGAVWRNPDQGHFEVPGRVPGSLYAQSHKRGKAIKRYRKSKRRYAASGAR